MMVERIGPMDPIQPGNRTGKSDPLRGGDRSDSISLSPEARAKAELYQVVELIKSVPELDDSQIAALREKSMILRILMKGPSVPQQIES